MACLGSGRLGQSRQVDAHEAGLPCMVQVYVDRLLVSGGKGRWVVWVGLPRVSLSHLIDVLHVAKKV